MHYFWRSPGTHVDALNHFSCDGKLHGGRNLPTAFSPMEGINHLSVDTIEPIVRRGVLLDIAGLAGSSAAAGLLDHP